MVRRLILKLKGGAYPWHIIGKESCPKLNLLIEEVKASFIRGCNGVPHSGVVPEPPAAKTRRPPRTTYAWCAILDNKTEWAAR